jgi:hypothetical protein
MQEYYAALCLLSSHSLTHSLTLTLHVQGYKAAVNGLTVTVSGLLWAVYQQAKEKGVQLTAKNCPTLVVDTSSK